jgi:hypothetical protein
LSKHPIIDKFLLQVHRVEDAEPLDPKGAFDDWSETK